jgi:hypothetical protein
VTYAADSGDARKVGHILNCLSEPCRQPLPAFWALSLGIEHLERDAALRLETQAHLEHVEQAAPEKSCADEQDDRHGDLCDNQAASNRTIGDTQGLGTAALFQSFIQVHSSGTQSRHETEHQTDGQ